MKKILEGQKVAVLVETEYIPEEIDFYQNFFTSHGAQVDFMTYLWGASERRIVSDVTNADNPKAQTMLVNKDIADYNPNDYAIVITAANYVACRLREIPPMGSLGNTNLLRSPAAVIFMASAMMNPKIVKGALCHALWILTPVPTNKPIIQYPKIHSWKAALHTFQHALFGYMTSSQIKGKEFDLYYAFPSEKYVSPNRVSPYVFKANIKNVKELNDLPFISDKSKKIRVTYDTLR